MQIQVEFSGPIQRGNWAQKETIPANDGSTLGEFLVGIGYPPEQHTHILVAHNGRVTRDSDTVLRDGDALQLSVLLGGG
ncbi:MAG: MoaD/ThiS family protein [Spirochaetota bacterium]|jgi:sulfur carrier protein ThiS|nr:MoaD/ThiS family protein [Spirochaetota bacterium]